MIQNMCESVKFGLLVWLCMMSTIAKISAQDPVFSQFYASPLTLNPALTGSSEDSKVVLNYRNQWPAINQAYVTYSASFDHFYPQVNSGFGVSVLADVAGRGLYKTTAAHVSYSYKVRFRGTFQMRLGISAGFINTRINWAQLIFPDQLDLEFGSVSPGGLPYPSDEVPPEAGNAVSVLDASAGLIMFNETFYGGIALKHLNTPQFSFLKVNDQLNGGLPMSLSIHGGAEVDLVRARNGNDVFVSPNFQYIRQGALSQLNIGTIFRYHKIGTGAWYRHSSANPDALIFLLEGRQDNIRVAYSYDLTLSRLAKSGGAHEISFMILFSNGQKESRYNDCFNLFR